MIKLKKLLESKNAFRREFGEPLPTLTDVMDKHQVEEDLDPYKDFGKEEHGDYDLNLGAFVDAYQEFIKDVKKLKPIPDKNKKAWALAIRKDVGQSMFNGYIHMWKKPLEVLKRFKKYEKLKNE